MEKDYFYKNQWKLTVKEVNEYADSIEDKSDIDCSVAEWIDTFKCMKNCHVFDIATYSQDFPYTVEISISEENGHIVSHAYDYDKYNKWLNDSAAVIARWHEDPDSNEAMPSIEEDFSFELPTTRGFSDSPDRCEVDLTSSLDIVCAIDEYIAEREGKQKVFTWQIKQLCCAGDFGLEEEEFDTLLEDCIA